MITRNLVRFLRPAVRLSTMLENMSGAKTLTGLIARNQEKDRSGCSPTNPLDNVSSTTQLLTAPHLLNVLTTPK